MNEREKAIVTAYTGISMLQDEGLGAFYKYIDELFGRPVYTHEIPILADEIKKRSHDDFIALCRRTEPEQKVGKWIRHEDEDGEPYGHNCSICGEWYVMPYGKTKFCPNCGAKMEE